MRAMREKYGLSGNALKIIALIAMTVDHIGVILLGGNVVWRIIGRISFPIFAFMIAEGCRYTKNKRQYLGTIFLLGAVCQAVYYFGEKSLYQGILITFSLSIIIIYAVEYVKKRRSCLSWVLLFISVGTALFLCDGVPEMLPKTDYGIDYGFCGVLLPALIFLPDKFYGKIIFAAAGTALVSISYGGIQWWSLAAIIPLAFYSGKRGYFNMKYLFYVYYPLHLAVLQAISVFIK